MRVLVDRTDAGHRLAVAVRRGAVRAGAWQVVVGLARGGVVVAAAVAHDLGLPLDVVVVRKLGAPGRPELGVGAVGEDDVCVVNDRLVERLGVDAETLEEVREVEVTQVHRRLACYRPDPSARPDLTGRAVLLVDDGLATGYTAAAAVGVARRRGATRLGLAVPVGSPEAVALLRPMVDALFCLMIPARLGSVGGAYRDFTQVDDDQVIAALRAGALPER